MMLGVSDIRSVRMGRYDLIGLCDGELWVANSGSHNLGLLPSIEVTSHDSHRTDAAGLPRLVA